MIPWEQIRDDALESGRVVQDVLARAKVEQDAGWRSCAARQD